MALMLLPASATAAQEDGRYLQVVGGMGFTVAVKADGTVWAWGSNSVGQLGRGTSGGSSGTPSQVLTAAATPLTGITAVSADYEHALALRSDGTVWAWGSGSSGQLGTGSFTSASYATQVLASAGTPLRRIRNLAAGGFHSLAVRADGTAWAWGSNTYGALGNGSTTSSAYPVQVRTSSTAVMANALEVAAGYGMSYVRRADGTLWGMGTNGYGQLAQGSYTGPSTCSSAACSTYAVQARTSSTAFLTNVVDVDGGGYHAVAVTATGAMYAMGNNEGGQLGTGSTTGPNSCQNGSGCSVYAVLTRTSSTTPLANVESASAGDFFSLATRADGTVWSTGSNGWGQLGNGSTTQSTYAVQARISSTAVLTNVATAEAGWMHAAALRADGTLWNWGDNGSGQLANGSTVNSPYAVQSSFERGLGFTSVMGAGCGATVGLRADGTVWVWGSGQGGMPGNGTTTTTAAAVQVHVAAGQPLTGITAISSGFCHGIALRADGSVWGWGQNDYGANGVGSDSPYAQQVRTSSTTTLANMTSVGGGGGQGQVSAAIRGDGTVWAWGWNRLGELANGTTTQSTYAVQSRLSSTTVMSAARAVAVGGSHLAVLRGDGTVYTAGGNEYGELARGSSTGPSTCGTTACSMYLVQSLITSTTPITMVADMSVGYDNAWATRADGSLWNWGSNFSGQLATGSSTGPNTCGSTACSWYALQVRTSSTSYLTDVVGAFGSRLSTRAVTASGAAWGWGANLTGELADGTTAQRLYATQSRFDSTTLVSGMKLGGAGGYYDHTLMLRDDGSIWGAGDNGTYELGDCTTINRSYPVQAKFRCTIAVTGTALDDEATTPWAQCDGTTANVAVSAGGATPVRVPCDAASGAYNATVAVSAANQVVVAYLDPAAPGDRGTTYTRSIDLVSGLPAITISRDRVRVRSESATNMANAAIATWDATQDPDIAADSAGGTLTVATGELHVDAGHTFAPGGNVTTPSLHVDGTYQAASTTVTLTGAGTGTCASGPGSMRPLCTGAGAYQRATATTRFTGSGTSHVEGGTYGTLVLQPNATSGTFELGATGTGTTVGTFTIGDGVTAATASTSAFAPSIDVTGNLTVTAASTLTGNGTGTITVDGNVGGAGAVNLQAGAFHHSAGASVASFGSTGGAQEWRFNDLAFSSTSGFGDAGSGMVTIDSGPTTYDNVSDSVLAPGGGFYVVGGRDISGVSNMMLRRYTANGALDTTFGTGGEVLWSGAGNGATVAVGPDGGVYVGGTYGTNRDIYVRKYTSAGAVAAWGSSGMVTYDSGAGTDSVGDIDVAADNSLFVAGRLGANSGDFFVRKYTSGGALASWGTSGMVIYQQGSATDEGATNVAVDSTGAIFVAGHHQLNGWDWILRRYTATGALDTAFGSSGMVTWDYAASQDIPTTMQLVGSDLYVGGRVWGSSCEAWAVRRYTTAGASVTGWASSGTLVYEPGSSCDRLRSLNVAADGGLYLFGYMGSATDWAARRYDASGAPVTAWGTNGMVTWTSSGSDYPGGSIVDGNDHLYLSGYGAQSGGGNDGIVRKYDEQGRLMSGSRTRLAAGGTGPLRVSGTATVGTATGRPATVDADANDRTIDVDGSLVVAATGSLSASATAPLTIAGDFTVDGTFTPNGGTVTIDDATRTSALTYAAPVTFANLRATTGGDLVRFDATDTTTVTGALELRGTSCALPLQVRSTVAGAQAPLQASGTAAVEYADIADSNALTALSASQSANGGNTAGWTFSSCATLTISVEAYGADGSGPTTAPASGSLGTLFPGATDAVEARVTVATDWSGGYKLWAHDADDVTNGGLSGPAGSIPWTTSGSVAMPEAWAGSGIGISAFGGAATPARWCAGGQANCTVVDDADLLWAALTGTDQEIASNGVANLTGDTTRVPVRLTVPAGQAPGSYSGQVAFTAIGQP